VALRYVMYFRVYDFRFIGPNSERKVGVAVVA